MKAISIISVCFIQLLFVSSLYADDAPSAQYWYQVTTSNPTYTYVGTSILEERKLILSIAKGDTFVEIDNLLYRDNTGKYKIWSEWDPTLKGLVFINSKNITEIKPMVGDPRKTSISEIK